MISNLQLTVIILLGFFARSLGNFSAADRILGTKEPKSSLRVAAMPHKPFMFRNEEGKFCDGIEIELIEDIVEKEQLKLSIESQPIPFEYSQQIFK